MSTAEPLTGSDPRSIGPYTLLGRLGSGGMGRVYLARTPDGATAAVKVVHEHLASENSFRERFRREIAAARRVSGPRTAAVLQAGPEEPQPWMAVEYVEGPTLERQVAAYGPLPIGGIFWLADGIAQALEEIHRAGVIHRDLKPTNVLLAKDGPRVIDFGIARATDASALTTMGMVTGSPAYMSPEQAVSGEIGQASDVFALGAVLYFAATGHPVFGSGAPAALLYRVVHNDPDLSAIADPELRTLIAACLGKDPARRPGLAVIRSYCAAAPGHRDQWSLGAPGSAPDDPPMTIQPAQTMVLPPAGASQPVVPAALSVPTQIGVPGAASGPSGADSAPASARRTSVMAALIATVSVLALVAGGLTVYLLLRPPADRPASSPGTTSAQSPGPARATTAQTATTPAQPSATATTPTPAASGQTRYLYQASADLIPGLSGTRRSYTQGALQSDNSTSFRVGCDGGPWPTAFTNDTGATRLTGVLLLDPETTPADLVVDVGLFGDGNRLGKWQLQPGKSVRINLAIQGARQLRLEATAVQGTCGTALIGYGVVVDGAVS